MDEPTERPSTPEAPEARAAVVAVRDEVAKVVVGQDGLVANVAKYLDGQPVVGIDPEPGRNPGVLVAHPAAAAPDLIVKHGLRALLAVALTFAVARIRPRTLLKWGTNVWIVALVLLVLVLLLVLLEGW